MRTKNLLLAFLILLLQQINGQEYNPLAVEGAHWIVRFDLMNTMEPVDGLWEYYSAGDTLINDLSYKKIFKRNLVVKQTGPPFQPETSYELFGLIRDDTSNKKVYAIQILENFNTCPINDEYLLFDFSLNIGDTADFCIVSDYFDFIVQDIYTTNVLGFNTRIFVGNESLYEGMGSNYGLFEEMFAPFKSSSRYVYHTFLDYYCHESPCDLLVSTNNISESQSTEIYPNPASHTIFIKSNSLEKIKTISIFNTLGQRVIKNNSNENQIDISALENGIYILKVELNGETVIRKIIKE